MATTVCLTFDFDAVSLWIGTFRLTTPTPVSRGEYGARVGVPRILRLLEKHGIPATFFVPGHTAAVFADAVGAVAGAGHEVAVHGYLHETPVGLERVQEAAILDRAIDILERTAGTRPVGYRSPAWDLSPHTIDLLAERGFLYDSSLMTDDFRPFLARSGDTVDADGTIRWGQPSAIVEFPVAWELDDFPHFSFMTRPSNTGLRNHEDVGSIWLSEFAYCHEHVSDGLFTLTLHPQVIGRGPRIEMLDRLIAAMKARPGTEFVTMRRAAEVWRFRLGISPRA